MSDDRHAAEGLPRQPRYWARVFRRVTHWTGSWAAIALVLGGVAAWLVVGFLLEFPRAWEVSVTAGVPLLTLLLLVIVQHTQNHDDKAMQVKLDEIIRSIDNASNAMLRVEEGGHEDVEELQRHFKEHADDRGARDGG